MSTLYMYYIIDCIQGNSKVGDYIIQICYVASMYVGSIALVHRRLMAITIYPRLPFTKLLYYVLYNKYWLGKVIGFVIRQLKLLGFKAKRFIRFKAFKGHI